MSDPVADFLAREQQAMAELDDESGVEFGSMTGGGGGEGGVDMGSSSMGDGQADFSSIGDMNADLRGAGAGEDSRSDTSSTHTTSMMNGSMTSHVPKVEPEKMRKWREEQKIMLEKKDATEEKEQGEWRSSAKKELDEWYRTRADHLDKSKKANRKAEDEAAATRTSTGGHGGDWENISKLCEFNPKNAKNTKDVSRLRSLLQQLKSPSETNSNSK